MTLRVCSVSDCGRGLHARGFCHSHYLTARKDGSLDEAPRRRRIRRPASEVRERDVLGRKLCPWCGEWLHESSFCRHTLTADGLRTSCRTCDNNEQSRAKYGLTREEVVAQANRQGGCRGCGRTEPGTKGWVVDHDHKCCSGDRSCGRCVRGVLCDRCNRILGFCNDDIQTLRNLIDYVQESRVQTRN